jgi:RNA polymerase sigma factor for flagellar operon FliA
MARITEKEAIDIMMPIILSFSMVMAQRAKPSMPWITQDDLIQEGLIGVVQAAREFDPQYGAAFKTYAYDKVKGAILDALRRANWVRRIRRNEEYWLEIYGQWRYESNEIAYRQGFEDKELGDDGKPWEPRRINTGAILRHWKGEDSTRESIEATLETIARTYPRDVVIYRKVFQEERRMDIVATEHGLTPSRVSQIIHRISKEIAAAMGKALPKNVQFHQRPMENKAYPAYRIKNRAKEMSSL